MNLRITFIYYYYIYIHAIILLFFVIAKKIKTKLCYCVQVSGCDGGGVQLPEKIPNLYYYIRAHAVYNRIEEKRNWRF